METRLDGTALLIVIFIACACTLTIVYLVMALVFGWIRWRRKKRPED